MRFVLLVLALLVSGLFPALADDKAASTPLPEAQKAAIEELIKTYLTQDHPEVVMDAIKELQRRDQASAEQKTVESIKTNKAKIYDDPTTPVGGNPKGDVTIVEFSDFQCGYCKRSEEAIELILKEDKGVRMIYKDFPVLGPESITASKVALAVFRQGNDKYVKMHDDLLSKKEHLTDDMIYQSAKSAGADVDKAKKDANDDAMQKQVQGNLDLGIAVGVRGTPMFIIGDKVYPGALEYRQMKKAVEDARAASKKG
jgi:protein-disulfide isomerase